MYFTGSQSFCKSKEYGFKKNLIPQFKCVGGCGKYAVFY